MVTKMLENQTQKASIVPDVSLMKKMASYNGTIVSRILELIDNSIDAKIEDENLDIKVRVTKLASGEKKISVIDNGTGMDEERASKFFRLADSPKIDGKKIGRFGLGAKIAILGLGDKVKIRTTQKGSEEMIEINFDVNKFSSWEIKYEKKKAKKEEHYTKIEIEDLTVRIGDIKKLEKRLSEAIGKTYKHFINDDDIEIKVNQTVVQATEAEIIDDYYEEFDFEVNGKRVHGWAGAMKTAGKNWKFGFDLINNKRIIKSNDFLTRQAHTSLARLTGEIYLDEFQTDVHKTDFIRDNKDFQEMQRILIEEKLDSLIAKVSKLTNRDVFMKYQDKMQSLSKVLDKVMKDGDFFNFLDLSEDIFEFIGNRKKVSDDGEGFKKLRLSLEATPVEKEENEKEEHETKNEKKENEKPPKKTKSKVGFYVDEPEFVSIGQENDSKRWETVEEEDGLHLKVEINMDHATYQTETEAEAFIKNAIIDSIAEFIVKEEEKNNELHDDTITRLNNIKDTIIRYSYTA